jgi:hypothetical protein
MKTYSKHDFTREERAARAKVVISAACESKEQAFLDFVLSHDIGRVFIGFQKYLYQQEARSAGTPLNR